MRFDMCVAERVALRLAACFIALFMWLDAAPAEACGGFFCNGPSACTGLFCTSAPTQQTGENILWAVEDDGTLTVHIQIQYAGESSAFAWILPLPAVPMSVGVGTDALFAQLAGATAPTYRLEAITRGTCRSPGVCEYPTRDTFGRGTSDAGARRADAAAADAASSGPTIHLRQEVGPYDSVVISGRSADEVLTWLRDNGFDIPSAAEPLIADYVAAEHVFVAVRLLSDRSAGEIQPLVLRYTEGQPCLPIRMTAIASALDMPITAYFLADAYAGPTNYSLIEPTYDEPRLWRGDLRQLDYIGRLVDDAGGHAFVTDFAGPTPALSLSLPDPAGIATLTDPRDVFGALQRWGYSGDPQLMAILGRYLPVPEGQAALTYYRCLSQSFQTLESCGYPGDMDAAGLAAAIEEQIRRPRTEATAMLARHSHLTRLYTTMDPSEMSIDPLFRIDPGLVAVSNVHTATLVTECSSEYLESSAPQSLVMPNGETAVWRDGWRYPGDEAYCASTGGRVPARGGCAVGPRGASDDSPIWGLGLGILCVALLRRASRSGR